MIHNTLMINQKYPNHSLYTIDIYKSNSKFSQQKRVGLRSMPTKPLKFTIFLNKIQPKLHKHIFFQLGVGLSTNGFLNLHMFLQPLVPHCHFPLCLYNFLSMHVSLVKLPHQPNTHFTPFPQFHSITTTNIKTNFNDCHPQRASLNLSLQQSSSSLHTNGVNLVSSTLSKLTKEPLKFMLH